MILVVGATGSLGGAVAQGLLAKGKKVRVLTRAGSNAAALTAKGAEAVTGDLKDPASLAKACAGIDTVVTTANSVLRGGADTVDSVDLTGNKSLIDAAKAAGVKHFVFVSALGAAENHPVPIFQAKAKTEAHLKSSGMAWTILAPNFFTDIWVGMVVGMPLSQGKPITLVGEGKRKHAFVSNADVAAFAIAAVDNPAAKNQFIPIAGPEALSWRDVVAAFEKAAGKSLPVSWVAAGTAVPGLPDMMWQTLAGMETFDTVLPMADTAAKYGVTQTTVAQFAAAALARK
ncbi:MAG: SDR family oxidoreductase [Deltaproteobacteria bacterium]|nr:SDR family oxidoreductase [Deltaproteobacteria bacterium]